MSTNFVLYPLHSLPRRIKGLPYMTSANFSDFLTPSPLVTVTNQLHFVFWGGPPTADVIYGSPLAPRASRAQSPASTIEELERPVRGGRFHELLKRRDREREGERRRECLQKRGRREEGGISNISLTVHDRRRRIRRGFRGTFLP